jgi:hypothetical protein
MESFHENDAPEPTPADLPQPWIAAEEEEYFQLEVTEPAARGSTSQD